MKSSTFELGLSEGSSLYLKFIVYHDVVKNNYDNLIFRVGMQEKNMFVIN